MTIAEPPAEESGALATGLEKRIHLNDVQLPGRNGKHVHPKTIWKWARFGINSRSGRRIFLDLKQAYPDGGGVRNCAIGSAQQGACTA